MRKTINSKRTVAYFQGAGPTILPGILEDSFGGGNRDFFWGGQGYFFHQISK